MRNTIFMRKIILTVGLLLIAQVAIQAQSWKNIFKGSTTSTVATSTTSTEGTTSALGSGLSGLTQNTASQGLKEALQKGVTKGVAELSATNGYLGNSLVKIGFPEELQMVEKALRKAGMGAVADKGIQLLNRAAEDAASSAAQIFVGAITEMTIQDAVSIVAGGNDAGTAYLKKHTTEELTKSFSPIVEKSLGRVNAPAYWKTVISKYNALPLTQNQIEPDLTKYVTQKAVDGMFVKIAEEEKLIRENPLERTSDILQKVFN